MEDQLKIMEDALKNKKKEIYDGDGFCLKKINNISGIFIYKNNYQINR